MTTEDLRDRIQMRLTNLANLASGDIEGRPNGHDIDEWMTDIDQAIAEVDRQTAAIMADVVYYAQQEGSR